MLKSRYKNLSICSECKSEYYKNTSEMEALCPDCASKLYGYENCFHQFENGRCKKCYWNGQTSDYLKNREFQKEKEFIEKFDNQFPAEDLKLSQEIIDKAIAISPNAVFFALEEITKSPQNKVTKKELVSYLNSKFQHSLKSLIINFVIGVIDGKPFHYEEIILAMKEVENYKNQYGALNILNYCYSYDDDKIDVEYERIIRKWSL